MAPLRRRAAIRPGAAGGPPRAGGRPVRVVLAFGCQTAGRHRLPIGSAATPVSHPPWVRSKKWRSRRRAVAALGHNGPAVRTVVFAAALAAHLCALGAFGPRGSALVDTACAQRARAAPAGPREHRVRAGQNLGRIAHRYQISADALASANHLRPDSTLQLGQILVIPAEGTISVRAGDTLEALARRHHVSAEDLGRSNHLRAGATLRAGQQLVVPGTAADRVAPSRWGRTRNPGVVALTRLATHRAMRIRLVDRRGVARRQALRDLAILLAPRHGGGRREPHPRLVRILARVSDHFGGRPLEIVSGVRPPGGYTRRESRHVAGEAIDFRIRGVPNTDLRDFCKTFDHVGVGFYPNSLFVHLDVRRDGAYWVDLSRPGDAPEYARRSAGAEQAAGAEPTEGGAGSRAASDDDEAGGEPESADDGAAPVDDSPGQLSDD